MNILIAPNAFKNAVSASAAAECIGEGLQQSRLGGLHSLFPVGDGGDGTGSLLIENARGTRMNALVSDPLGRPVRASFGLTGDSTAIIELADTSGLRLLRPGEMDPLHASTRGAGELIKVVLDKKVNRIILCIGGSGTIDGGTGLLQGLGIRFLDSLGNELKDMPESLTGLVRIDFSGLDKRIRETELILLCDVENTLLGKQGAAAVFGPQKGATEKNIEKLDACLSQLRKVVFDQLGKDMATLRHGGAAGGVAAGLAAILGARLVNGIDYFLDYTFFDKALGLADLVITGEGSIDNQTLQGKGPFGVARRAKEKGIPVIGLAGKVPLSPEDPLRKYFDILLPIGNRPLEMTAALRDTSKNLIRTARALGDLLTLRLTS
jgi:glycerate 2-kinase